MNEMKLWKMCEDMQIYLFMCKNNTNKVSDR